MNFHAASTDKNFKNEPLRRAETVAKLLDSQFNFFGVRVGIDPILGLIPFGGDFLAFLLGLYIIGIAIEMHLPASVITKMIILLVADFALGEIPIIGDIADFFFKSNSMNLNILKKYHNRPLEGEIID